jgi:hypothetical protein
LTFFLFSPAEARQGLLRGRAEGVISQDVSNSTVEKIIAAAKKILGADGFKATGENPKVMTFDRRARLGKDISYTGLANENGSWERLEILINDNGAGSFRLECNPSIVTDKDSFFENQNDVLKMFAGEYRRLMRRVAREASN